MNPDLHMADDLKNTGKGNLFVVFGEPDMEIEPLPATDQVRVRIIGVDVFDPRHGRNPLRRHRRASPPGSSTPTTTRKASSSATPISSARNDPYKALKTALQAEIDEEAWATLYRDVSRPFPGPTTGRIAVKVINHFGDEVMKVFSV